ncbi:MAG: type III secretion T3S chaperone [Simkaniaceae bacterium]|nr:type III secretion T3S chaperone [Simkaniaceae bacterium]
MTAPSKYPLAQLVRIKQRRLEEAEKELRRRRTVLDEETDKYRRLEESKNETLRHKEEKLDKLRTELDEGTTSDKIDRAHKYIDVVDEELEAKEKKVSDQHKAVETARGRVEEARRDVIGKERDMEKLRMHRREWEKEMKALQEYEAGIETDEIGNVMHNVRRFKREG